MENSTNGTKSIILVTIGWQFSSFVVASVLVFSEFLTESGWSTPTLMNSPMYLLLFLFTLIRSCICSKSEQNTQPPPLLDAQQTKQDVERAGSIQNHDQGSEVTKTNDIPHIYYILAAIFDVEANVIMLHAYQYTTITSVSLLDCFAIPMVMFWGYLIFGRKYKLHHFLGIIVSLAGMMLLIYTDWAAEESDNRGANPILGDILVLCATASYSVSNAFAEYAVKNNQSIWKYIQKLGFYGFIITLIQGFIFEHEALFHQNEYSLECLLFLCGYVFCSFAYYVVVPSLLQYSSTVVCNLSLLSADFWAVLAGVFLFAVTLNYLYFIAFILIIGGVVWYNIANYVYKVDN